MNEKISIRKSIYDSIKFREVVDTNFSELFTPNRAKPSLTEFFDLYNEMFLEIPENGEFSHAALARKSQQLISPTKDAKDKEIENLQSTIQDLQQKLLSEATEDAEALSAPKEHPRFSNGTIIRRPENSPVGWPNVFLMDQGFKRPIYFSGNGEFFKSFLDISGYDVDTKEDGNYIPRIPDLVIDDIPTGDPLTEQNFNEPFNPSKFLTEAEEIRINLDPTDAKLNFDSYDGDIDLYKSTLDKDFEEKTNYINALTDKINELKLQIQQIKAG